MASGAVWLWNNSCHVAGQVSDLMWLTGANSQSTARTAESSTALWWSPPSSAYSRVEKLIHKDQWNKEKGGLFREILWWQYYYSWLLILENTSTPKSNHRKKVIFKAIMHYHNPWVANASLWYTTRDAGNFPATSLFSCARFCIKFAFWSKCS